MFRPLRLYLRSLVLEVPASVGNYLPKYGTKYTFTHSLEPTVELLEAELLRILRTDDDTMAKNIQDFLDELRLCMTIAVRFPLEIFEEC